MNPKEGVPSHQNHKTMLQEVLDERGWGKPVYQSTSVPVESMPSKFKFRAQVSFAGERFQSIKGFDRKKDAEQDAAHNALKWITKVCSSRKLEEDTPKPSYLRAEEEVTDSGEDGDNLINSKVQVWWRPNDQEINPKEGVPSHQNHKTMLQEVLDERGWGKPVYESTPVLVESMPSKFKFRAQFSFAGERFQSIKEFDRKKGAEQDAAHNALKWITKVCSSRNLEEDTPKPSYQRAEEEAADSGEDGDNLVNSKVKVWRGPNDQEFYEGVIVSFDSIAKTHKFAFEEDLNLRNTKWEFVGEGSKSDVELEATQWLSSDHFREMSSRKRIKTNSKANGSGKGKEIKKTEERKENEMVKAVESCQKKMSSEVRKTGLKSGKKGRGVAKR